MIARWKDIQGTKTREENDGSLNFSKKNCLLQSKVKNNKEQRPIISCFNPEIFEKLKYVEC